MGKPNLKVRDIPWILVQLSLVDVLQFQKVLIKRPDVLSCYSLSSGKTGLRPEVIFVSDLSLGYIVF